MKKRSFKTKSIGAVAFDFDGVLTDNKVYVDATGNELVRCSRSDGLGFDVLRALKVPAFIISREKNPVVIARAKKLKVRCIHGVDNKSAILRGLAAELEIPLRDWLYVGNDLNDIPAMRACGFSACPSDAHPLAKKTATTVLRSGGGDRVVLEVLESLMHVETEKYFR